MDKLKVKWSAERKARWMASRYPAKAPETGLSARNSGIVANEVTPESGNVVPPESNG